MFKKSEGVQTIIGLHEISLSQSELLVMKKDLKLRARAMDLRDSICLILANPTYLESVFKQNKFSEMMLDYDH